MADIYDGSWCGKINNWNIVKKISLWFGVVFIVFAILTGIINYGYNHLIYNATAPSSLFIYSILIAILPYLLAAVISFVIYAFSSKTNEIETEKKIKQQETTEDSDDNELHQPVNN